MPQVHLSGPADVGDNLRFARAFQESMTSLDRVPAYVVRKSNEVEMKVIAAALDAIRAVAGSRVPPGASWMQWGTTLGPKVYMPDGLSLLGWIEMLTHELEHVSQFWRGEFPEGGVGERALPGGIGMAYLYLAEDIARVRYECRAYTSGSEVRSHLRQPLPSLDEVQLPLEQGYMLGPKALHLARSIMDANLESVEAGTLTTVSGRIAVNVLEDLGRLYEVVI